MTIAILLATGFEEIEAISIIDILRRANIPTQILSINDNLEVVGAHQVSIKADKLLKDISFDSLQGIVLPGGLPGSINLANSPLVIDCLQTLYNQKKLTAAICAAPLALAKAGILKDHQYTCYPGCQEQISLGTWSGDEFTICGNVITGRCPGAAINFSLALVKYLTDNQTQTRIAQEMIVTPLA